MNKLHTHYDNLNVARNAPTEVIQAAYRALSLKYHPDRNENNPEAARIMSIINLSYSILSDSAKRREHDQWISAKEDKLRQDSAAEMHKQFNEHQHHLNNDLRKLVNKFRENIHNNWIPYGLAFLLLVIFLQGRVSSNSDVRRDRNISATINIPAAVNTPAAVNVTAAENLQNAVDVTAGGGQLAEYKPKKAPNGTPWPKSAGYVRGYPKLMMKGHSQIIVDNTNGMNEILGKIFSLNAVKPIAVRVFYVPAFSKFRIRNMAPGDYNARYKVLDTNRIIKTDSFTLHESPVANGIEYDIYKFTIYKVANGNLHSSEISEDDF